MYFLLMFKLSFHLMRGEKKTQKHVHSYRAQAELKTELWKKRKCQYTGGFQE